MSEIASPCIMVQFERVLVPVPVVQGSILVPRSVQAYWYYVGDPSVWTKFMPSFSFRLNAVPVSDPVKVNVKTMLTIFFNPKETFHAKYAQSIN